MTNARILVVRSDGPDAGGLAQSLRDLGYDVCAVAASAAEAIEKAVETAPDAALIDLDLGADVSGLEAAERIGSELVFGADVVGFLAWAAQNKKGASLQMLLPYYDEGNVVLTFPLDGLEEAMREVGIIGM